MFLSDDDVGPSDVGDLSGLIRDSECVTDAEKDALLPTEPPAQDQQGDADRRQAGGLGHDVEPRLHAAGDGEWKRPLPLGEVVKLDDAVAELLARATRGSRASKSLGKQTLYAQLDRPEADAYQVALEVMAAASQLAGAREGMSAFLEKRPPEWPD